MSAGNSGLSDKASGSDDLRNHGSPLTNIPSCSGWQVAKQGRFFGRMRTLKLTVAYDGTDFAGWQLQPGRRTVQGVVEHALAPITGQSRTLASGRTDAGVHALAQVVRVRTESIYPPETIVKALNARLPSDVAALCCQEVSDRFHPIRDAVGKTYRYVLHDGPLRDVFHRRTSWKLWEAIDERAMRHAARVLCGRHDFRSFQTSGSQRKTTVRNVRRLEVTRGFKNCPHLIAVEIEADGFLYNMARAIVGALVEIGRGKRDSDWLAAALAATNRAAAARTAPPEGLFLVKVDYGAANLGGENAK